MMVAYEWMPQLHKEGFAILVATAFVIKMTPSFLVATIKLGQIYRNLLTAHGNAFGVEYNT